MCCTSLHNKFEDCCVSQLFACAFILVVFLSELLYRLKLVGK